MEKGIVISLIVVVIGTGGNVAEVEMFCSVFGNHKFWILDLEAGLSVDLGDMKKIEEEWLEKGSHGEDYNPQQFLYSLSTTKALSKLDSNFQVCLASE